MSTPVLQTTPLDKLAELERRLAVLERSGGVSSSGGGPAPPGTVVGYAGATPPSGWLLCDGQVVSRTTYAALFAAIGTTYGPGDGTTTFNVPNLKGRLPVGRDAAQTEFDVLGETGGAKTVTLGTAEIPAHAHTQAAHNHVPPNVSAFETVYVVGGGSPNAGSLAAGNWLGYRYATDQQPTINNTGGSGAHNNLSPYLVVNFLIRT